MVLLRIIILTTCTALSLPPISQPIYLHRAAGIRAPGLLSHRLVSSKQETPLPSGLLILYVKLPMSWYPMYF